MSMVLMTSSSEQTNHRGLHDIILWPVNVGLFGIVVSLHTENAKSSGGMSPEVTG